MLSMMNMQCFNCPFDSTIDNHCPATWQDNRLNQVSDQKRRIKMQVPCMLWLVIERFQGEFTLNWPPVCLVKILGLVIQNQKEIINEESTWIKPDSKPSLEMGRTLNYAKTCAVWMFLQEYRRDVDRQMEAGQLSNSSSKMRAIESNLSDHIIPKLVGWCFCCFNPPPTHRNVEGSMRLSDRRRGKNWNVWKLKRRRVLKQLGKSEWKLKMVELGETGWCKKWRKSGSNTWIELYGRPGSYFFWHGIMSNVKAEQARIVEEERQSLLGAWMSRIMTLFVCSTSFVRSISISYFHDLLPRIVPVYSTPFSTVAPRVLY